jgi:hypothetical protein
MSPTSTWTPRKQTSTVPAVLVFVKRADGDTAGVERRTG